MLDWPGQSLQVVQFKAILSSDERECRAVTVDITTLYVIADHLSSFLVKQHRRIGLDTEYICR